jgi:tetratricopeptide (TPR) repeat protein
LIYLTIFVGLAMGAGVLMSQSPHIRERVDNIVDPDHTRFNLWRSSIEQWKLQPLVGTGSGSFRYYGREFRAEQVQGDPMFVHNDYLHLLCEYGLIGAALFLLLLGSHLRHGWRSFVEVGPRRFAEGSFLQSDRLALTIGALSALAAYGVHSLVDFNMHIPPNALLIAFVFGLLGDTGVFDASRVPSRLPVSSLRLATVAIGLILLLQCVRLLPGEYFAEKARVALEYEDPEAAIVDANNALAYEQKNPNIYFYLGRSLGAIANEKRSVEKRDSYYEAALGAFDKARKLAPLDGFYALDMAYAYDAMGRFSEAEWMYGVARSRDPRSVMMSELYQTHLETWKNDWQKNIAVSP